MEKGGQTVTDWESLRGQTIYATGKGSTPASALNYLLEENGCLLYTSLHSGDPCCL